MLKATLKAWQDNGLPEEAFEGLHRRIAQLEDVVPLGSMLSVIARQSVELGQALTEESREVPAVADRT